MGVVLSLVRLMAIVSWRLTRLIVLLLWMVLRALLQRRHIGKLGSARFASSWEMMLAGVRRGTGPIVGRSGRSFLRFNRDGMIAVFAPMGAGKGVGIVIPNLLSYRGSIVCTDIKGENFAITARHRRKLGPVYVLNTASPTVSDVFNPMDMIRVGTWHEKDDAEALAKLMVTPERQDSHWDSKAEGLLTCLILHAVRQEPNLRTLAHVRTLSTLGPESLKELLNTIASAGSRHAAELATSFLSMEGSEEFRNVLSNTEKATRVWSAGSPAGEISGRSSFQLADLVDNVGTLYLIVDEEKLAVYAGFLRVLVGCVINALTRSKSGKRPKRKVLLLLDEAAALGRLEPLERGVGFLRAYCTPLLVFQDMAQLKTLYQRANSFLANATCKVFFNVSDLDAAKFVSEIIGHTTTAARNRSVSQTNTELIRESHSSGLSETGRWLLDPAEVMRLPGHRSIILYRSDILRFPVLARKVNYRAWRHWYWWGRYDRWGSTPASVAMPQECSTTS